MQVSTAAVPALPQSDAEIEERSDDDAEGLDAKMHGLLDRAVGQNTASSRQELFHKILDQIKDDEMLMVTVGAVLGFPVGELQVVLVEQFAR
jgi:hypothetical protein